MGAATSERAGPPTVSEILRGTDYALTIFEVTEIRAINIFEKNGKPYLKCFATDKDRPAKPEEIVRQLYIKKLIDHYGYPKNRIRLEKPVWFGSAVHVKKADIVVIEPSTNETPYIIVEVKKPSRRDGLEQLKSYCNAEGSPVGVWTNGSELVALHREEPNLFRNLPNIPKASQTLDELLDTPWTLADLTANNRLVVERTSLKDIIIDMEDLVLANAGVDAFEEVFKLIFAKLYDEWSAARRPRSQALEFRVGRKTAAQFSRTVSDLLARAVENWPGVFDPRTDSELEPEHLKVCGSFLEDVKLFNSNLQIIDEAFEYLTVQASKGEKGQYFTPRHVIDMCVKMLNPTVDEYVIDTAAGSCGFTVHSIFHVWGSEFTADGPNRWQAEYAATHVYAIDFDKRAARIARALNLIAGDGRTNVYRANSLHPREWPAAVRAGLLPRLRRYPDDRTQDVWNQENFRYFNFDVMLTNPPFAGDIKETRILSQFQLAHKANGKLEAAVGRDILFIERNLEFLRPGGRAAIVLPQGRFNNSSDEAIRRWIADRARILAVVGLHGNTFKPHTGTKTSVLFIQLWNDDEDLGPLNPKTDDYPVFLATSEKPGKDNSGDYIYRIGPDNAPLLDSHNHMIVEHDLHEIATNFVAWGRKQNFEFCEGDE